MFAARICVQSACVRQSNAGFWSRQPRRLSTLSESVLQTPTPLAKQLAATNLWYYGRNKKASAKGEKKPKADKARVNIVGDKLCDDIINYIKPTLERHVGCDLIDLFPGAGLWSRKLHDALQPRSHILMEPDAEFYAPFLAPLTSRPNVTLLPKSGIIWTELNEVLTPDNLLHQKEQPRSETPKQNNTLLVTANLSWYPGKRYGGFSNVSQLLLYQFIHSIRSDTLFQKYGLVRMLLWMGDGDKSVVVPRTVQRRKRLSVDAELSTEYVCEIAGADPTTAEDGGAGASTRAHFFRDRAIDLESTRNVLARMQAAGTTIPPGRESSSVRDLQAMSPAEQRAISAGSQPAFFDRPFRAELEALEADFARGKFSSLDKQPFSRLKDLRYKVNWELKRNKVIHDLLSDPRPTPPAEWDERIRRMDKYLRIDFCLARDNLHVFRQQPPVLTWDRRPAEPLVVRAAEFFPNVPCALLDVQPKAMHPLLRQMGPGTNRAGETFAVLLSSLMRNSTDPVGKVLESVYPGAREGVVPNCPSLEVGGGRAPGYAEFNARVLQEKQWVEILEAWMRWPFRPGFSELVARGSEDSDLLGDDDGTGNSGDFV